MANNTKTQTKRMGVYFEIHERVHELFWRCVSTSACR